MTPTAGMRMRTCGLLLTLVLAGSPLWAERYALLIGVGNYAEFPAFHLDGPAEDVPAVHNALTRTWKFPEKNIRVLLDAQATKTNILEALDSLVRQVKAGDEVFIYYSGHGTSALDPRNSKLGLPLNSGALIPSDVRSAPPAGLLQQFIIGAIDLRPRLEALDALASVFVVMDSCYSGAAVKSVADHLLTSRSIPLALMSRAGSMVDDEYDAAYTSVRMPAVDTESYPYRRLIFLSAAAQSEKAYEASRAALEVGIIQTVDGKPHGLLTDSLLRAFRGDADENHDGQVTYDEVRRFALARVMSMGQTPQLLPANEPDLTAQPIFAVAGPRLDSPVPPEGPRPGVTVHLSAGAQGLAPELAALPEVRLVEGQAADLAITRAGDRYELYVANGIRIQDYRDSEVPRLLTRVRREPQIRNLRGWVFPKQGFHADLQPEPGNRDAYALGEGLQFDLRADRASYFLLLNIDVSGEVTVVYKTPAGAPAQAGQTIPVVTCLTAPAGAEYMKLFAFAAAPAGWDAISAASIPADTAQMERLMGWLKSAPPDSAQATWLTYSTDRRPPAGRGCGQ